MTHAYLDIHWYLTIGLFVGLVLFTLSLILPAIMEGLTQKEAADIRAFLWRHFKTLATLGVNKLAAKAKQRRTQ